MDPILAEVYSTVLPAAPFAIAAYVGIWLALAVYALFCRAAPSASSATSVRSSGPSSPARKSSSAKGVYPPLPDSNVARTAMEWPYFPSYSGVIEAPHALRTVPR